MYTHTLHTYIPFILACGSFNVKFTSKTQNYSQMYWSRYIVGR